MTHAAVAHVRRNLRRLALSLAMVVCLGFAAPSAASAAPEFSVDNALVGCPGGPIGSFVFLQTSGSGFTAGTALSAEWFHPDGNYSAIGTYATVGSDGTFTAGGGFGPLVNGTYRMRVFTDADQDLHIDEGGEAAEDTFEVNCAEPLPTTREECDKGSYEVFKNRGDCVAFVSTGGKNEPGQNVPGAP